MPGEFPVYLRPCPMTPDGIEMTERVADLLIDAELMVPEDEWPGDYHFAHEDNEGPQDEAILRRIEVILARYPGESR